jgi:tRNA 2-thiouridine synthesizing protein E
VSALPKLCPPSEGHRTVGHHPMTPPFDNNGYLKNREDWSPQLAEAIAKQEHLILTTEHWDIIYLLREYYFEHQSTPSMRTLIQTLSKKWEPEKTKSAYINRLFPMVFFLQASKIAGLPKPSRCI